MNFRFHTLRETDLPILHAWLNKPHVAERWGGAKSVEEVREDYFTEDGDEAVHRYVVWLDEVALGYIQSYSAVARDGWWQGDNAQDPGTVGIDFFIGEDEYLDKGIGTEMIKEFVKELFADASVVKVISDPAPENHRSIRCLEKAGFRSVKSIVTPDGAAILMEIRRQ